ncbi:MAG: cysteine methyltransferase [Actinomycetia bacterium]|jgi:alkylated DNA nucleotide flippase Atl1|nr:cysteine methyltransferase [Actinomycetes bacterium]MDQ1644021.1 methylated-DNA-protein-cysteine methyltransferase related protein [Cryptosporangiaceae bacterium]MDQ1652128.1 methylated-DNA-protein-cysteine methyltransferase related protein [Cryptosporangiaceae bacterium]MDQ1659562.1 methylated-DNA-protein-cysteine methyltransferase related protein [Cryptosporangiaceae bacterium]
MEPSEYAEAVLELVERIPPGRVMSYGMIAELVRESTGRGSARTVGTVMARYGGGVPWHRVVSGAGRLPPGHEVEAGARLRSEGVPFRGERVELDAVRWWPGE